MRLHGAEPSGPYFEKFDTKLRFHYIGLRKLSGLTGLVWGRTGTKTNEASETLPRRFGLRYGALTRAAIVRPRTPVHRGENRVMSVVRVRRPK